MRTVDPEVWSQRVARRALDTTRPLRFGQQPAAALEARLRHSLRDAAAEYLRHCSHAAAHYYRLDYNNHYHRARHVLVAVVSLVLGAALLVRNLQAESERPPLVVSPQITDHSALNYKFPAVALCSNNIISKTALKNFTNYLFNHPKNKLYGFSEEQIEHYLLDLGALQTFALPPVSDNFDKFFHEVEPNFNVTDIMFRLSANCSLILLRCSWRGHLVDCERMFAARLTALGFCCVFNSRYQAADFNSTPVVLDLLGQDYGLGVVVQELRDDFAYVRRPTLGLEMLLFEGEEFPLIESGDVHMYPLPRNSSVFFEVRTFMQYPTDEISFYDEERRGCRLGGGGMSWCLARCRREIMQALCGCVPYALQPQYVPHHSPTCTLSEVACLNKHREKFMYLFPGDDAVPQLSQESQDALDCLECTVQCRRHIINTFISYTLYGTKSGLYRNFLTANLTTMANTTVLRVFYNKYNHKWYKVEVMSRWFELMIKLSTQWVVPTGVSVLCCAELVFHGTLRWLHHFLRRTTLARVHL